MINNKSKRIPKTAKKTFSNEEEIKEETKTIPIIKESENETTLLKNKKVQPMSIEALNQSDSSDEEILLRTGNVPREWYKDYEHAGYDVNSNKVIKPPKEDEVEKFMKQANDKNWWRNIFDEDNNKNIYLSDKDIEMIKRIKSGKFANAKIHGTEYEYFEQNLQKELYAASSHQRPKRSFEPSKNEQKMINRLVRAYNDGFIKLFDDEEDKKKEDETLYDIWSNENTDPNKYVPGKGYAAPKRSLPDVEQSYNAPDNVIKSLIERKEEFDKKNIYGLEPDEDEKVFEARKYESLRKIPVYSSLIRENFERLCDLFMSARYIRKKKDIKEEDLIPQLPKPEELKPFPTTESVYFRGHESSIRSLCVDPQGKYLISADSAGYVMFWDIETTKIVKRINVSDDILHVVFNPVLNLLTVVCKETLYFVLPPYLDKKTKTEVMSLIDTKVYIV